MTRKILLAGLVLTVAMQMAAQSTTGTIRGIVKDSSKNTLPGVHMTLRNADTRAVYRIVTNEAGEYRFDVPAGVYEIKADLPGFQSAMFFNLELKATGTLREDFTMTIPPPWLPNNEPQVQPRWIPL